MMFRRLRSSPRVFIGFRVVTVAVGLMYVLATTDTIKTIRLALESINKVGEAIESVSGSSAKPNTQDVGKTND